MSWPISRAATRCWIGAETTAVARFQRRVVGLAAKDAAGP
jgi:hypothetical protein